MQEVKVRIKMDVGYKYPVCWVAGSRAYANMIDLGVWDNNISDPSMDEETRVILVEFSMESGSVAPVYPKSFKHGGGGENISFGRTTIVASKLC